MKSNKHIDLTPDEKQVLEYLRHHAEESDSVYFMRGRNLLVDIVSLKPHEAVKAICGLYKKGLIKMDCAK